MENDQIHTHETYKRTIQIKWARDLEKRPTKETYKRDVQKRPTQEFHKRDISCMKND